MPTISTHAPGTFCWPELATTDSAAAKALYAELFGWTTLDFDMGPNGFYHIFQLGGRHAGAMYVLSADMKAAGVPPHWGAFIAVESADDAAKKAVELGGRLVMGPFDVGEDGRLAIVTDTVGATINLWQGKGTPGVGVMHEPGSLAWTQLNVTDPAKAKAFYGGLFGWGANETGSLDGSNYTQFTMGKNMIAGMMPMPEGAGAPSHWLTYFASADVDASHAIVAKHGGQTFVPPSDIPGVGRFCVVGDPQGAIFAMAKFLPPPGA